MYSQSQQAYAADLSPIFMFYQFCREFVRELLYASLLTYVLPYIPRDLYLDQFTYRPTIALLLSHYTRTPPIM